MPNRYFKKNPSLLRHTRDTLIQELWAWITLFRTEWRWVLIFAFGVSVLLFFTKPLPQKDVYLAVGQHGSKFEFLGEKFTTYFSKQGLKLHLVNTMGSGASLAELADEDVNVDAALLVGGVANKGQFSNLLSLGSVETIPLWIFYRGKEFDGKSAYDFFHTKKVAIGNVGSASESVLKKTLALSGIELQKQDNFLQIPDQQAVQMLIDGQIDAMCIMDGINAPNVIKLLAQHELHILNFPHAAAYVKKLPFFSAVVIPAGALDLKAGYPSKDITMLASTGTLLVEQDLHPVIQQTFLLAADAIGKQDDQFFSNPDFFPKYVDRTIPLSPVARKFYEEGPPSFRDRVPLWLINYVDRIWFLLIGVFALIYPLFKLFPSYRSMRSVMLIEDAYDEIQAIENEATQTTSASVLQALMDRLLGLEVEIRQWSISSEEMNRLYTMKSALNLIKQFIANLQKNNSPRVER